MFAILTGPLHTQGAKNTESVDQPSYRQKERGQCPPQKAPSCTLPMSTPKALTWGLTFCNVPRDSSQEHFAGVDGVLVVSGRQLPAPGAGCFVHSLEKRPVLLSTGSFPSHSPTGLPTFPNYRLSRAAQPQAAAHTCLFSQQVEPESGLGLEQALLCCILHVQPVSAQRPPALPQVWGHPLDTPPDSPAACR